MARSRPAVAVTADWGGVSTDISGAVVSGRVTHGSGETNPDRSTVDTARGTLVLEGEDYQPGGSSRWTEAQLSTRAAIRVTLGAVTLWEGWADQPRAIPRAGRPQTRYRLSGKLDEYATRQVDVSSASANLYTDSTLWAEVTGAAPRLTGAAGAGITFAPFMFEGRGFEVASLAALVGGRLAGEDRLGRLTMPTYGRLPPAADQKTVSSAALLIQNVETDKRVEQVRNRLRIPFDVAPASETVGADAQGSWDGVGETADSQTGRGRYQHTGVETLPTVTFRQPAPTAPTTFGRMSVSVAKVEIEVAATQLVVGNDPFTYHWRYAWVTIPSSLISASGSQSNINGRETLAVTMRAVSASDAISWTLAITNSRGQMSTQNWDYDDLDDLPFYRSALTPATLTVRAADQTQVQAAHRSAHRLRVTLRVSWTATTPQTAEQVVDNIPSQGQWGIRAVVWPVWVTGSGNTERIQADLDDLAEPRTYHDVTLPLWQETSAKSRLVAALDYGDYVDLGLLDRRRGVNLAAKTVVTRRGLSWGNAQVPEMRLRLLETGESGTPVAVVAPGPPRNLDVASPRFDTVNVSWDAPNTGGAATGYELGHRVGSSGAYTTVEVTGTSHVLTTVASTRYEVRLRATNSAGNSSYVTGSVTTPARPSVAAPGPPRNLDVAAPNSSTINVSWDAPNTGGPLGTYSLRYRRQGTGGWQDVTGLTSTSYVIPSDLVVASTTYEVEVRSVGAGGSSSWVAGSVTTPAAAPAPTTDTPAPVATFQRYIGSTFANITWTIAVPATQQLVDTEWRWNNGGGAWTTVDGVSSTRAALARRSVQGNGTINIQARAQYRLRAPPRTVAWSEWSNTITFQFPAPSSATQPGQSGSWVPVTLDGAPITLDGAPITLT